MSEFDRTVGSGGDAAVVLSRRERLIGRVVDGEATDGEWAEFRALADGELPPGVAASAWRELAEAQRAQALLSGAVGGELAAAEAVETPRVRPQLVGSGPGGSRLRRAVAVGGWMAVAATVALSWVGGWTFGAANQKASSNQAAGFATIPAGYVKIDKPEDAVNAYVQRCQQDQGVEVRPVPERVLVATRPKPNSPGVYEVVYVRQFLERGEVKGMFRMGQDELGRPRLVPTSPPAIARASQLGS